MTLTTLLVIFLATLSIGFALVVTILPPGDAVRNRLVRLWQPSSPSNVSFRQKQQDRVERALGDVGQLMPLSQKESSGTRRLMIRAGFRRPESIHAFRGMKVLSPVLFLILVWVTGFYLLNPILILTAAAVVGFVVPDYWLTSRVRVRQRRILLGLPDALDLLMVCVEAGLGLDQALVRVARELQLSCRALSDELKYATFEMRVGRSRSEALRDLGVRTGVEDVKTVAAMLIQTDRFGTDLARALRIQAENMRVKRRQRAEELAAKASVKMVPALVFFIFPAMFVVILGPAVILLVRQLLPSLR
jgi:tight adherence protein C